MEIGLVLPSVATPWGELRSWAVAAEDAGFDSLWVIDHLDSTPPGNGVLESWTVISALAAVTRRVGLGAQVFCSSFRIPGVFAKMATTLDLVSSGRARVLLGAGWNEAEHAGFGVPFKPPGQRVTDLEEAVDICRGLWDAAGEPFSYTGSSWSLQSGVNRPPPERRIPLGVGGSGHRVIDLAARKADEWNCPAQQLPSYDGLRKHLDERCAAAGTKVRRTLQSVFNPGDRPVGGRRAAFHPELGLKGTEDEMVDRIGALEAQGVDGLYGYVLDREGLDRMGEALPAIRKG